MPTLTQFAPRFIEGYAEANRQKPSEIAAKRTILNVHLIPSLGTLKLDAVTNERIQLLKHRLKEKAPKTVNNILTVLSVLMKKAVEWDVIERMPCTIRLLKAPKKTMGFYDFDEYDRLVEAAQNLNPATYLVALLGGDAGLRCGEIIALEWGDVDLRKRQLCIQRSEWRGHVTVPKGGRLRHVPMTIRLAAALRDQRHLKAARVLCQRDGSALIQEMVGDHVRRAGKRAGVAVSGAHRLRHHADSRIMPTALSHQRDRGGDRALPETSVGIIRGGRETREVDRTAGNDPA